MQPTNTLRPIIPDNASPLRITAAAGTKLAGASSLNNVIIFINERTLQPNCNFFAILFCCPHSRNITGSSFRLVSKIPHCWLKPRPYLSPSVADRFLKPTKDHRLGEPLPHQQPNPAQAHLKVVLNLWYFHCITFFL